MDCGVINIETKQIGHHVQIIISDNGPGISEEILSKLGQPFFSTKTKGTGLGLLICYKIVESHNGKIDITSEEGNGTKVSILLPLYE